MMQVAEVLVIAVAIPGEKGPERMMEVVAPLGVVREAAAIARQKDTGVVEVALSDEMDVAVQVGGLVVDGVGEFGEEWGCGLVVDGVNGVEAEGVDVEFGNPAEGVFEEVAADFVAVCIVEVDGGAPRGSVFLSEVRAEGRQVIAFRAEVVVDDVEHDGEAALMACVDEAFEAVRAAIGCVDGEGRDSVIAPVAAAGEGRDGHDFNGRDAGVDEGIKVRDDGVEGALRSESADVQLVEDVLVDGEAAPSAVVPAEGGAGDLGWAVHALGLEARSRIGKIAAIDTKEVACAWGDVFEDKLMVAVGLRLHGQDTLVGVEQAQMDGPLRGSPDAKVPCAGGKLGNAVFPQN